MKKNKSKLTELILNNNPNFVVIDSDKYREAREDALQIAEKYPDYYGFLTWEDYHQHRDDIYKEAYQNNYNIIREAVTSLDWLFNNNINYTIELNIIAVSLLNSLISTKERYEEQKMSKIIAPKSTSIERHDKSFEALEQLLEEINYKDIPINMYIRGNKTNNYLPIKVNIEKFSSINQALKYFQAKDEVQTIKNFETRYKKLLKQMQKRNASKEQFKDIEEIYRRYESIKRNGMNL